MAIAFYRGCPIDEIGETVENETTFQDPALERVLKKLKGTLLEKDGLEALKNLRKELST